MDRDRLARHVLTHIERRLTRRPVPPQPPQLLVLGLPRSGTTLVYQYAVHRLEVAYFTNGVGRFPCAPATVSAVQNRLWGPYRSDFASSYGRVRGHTAPREAGALWGRAFGHEDYVASPPPGAAHLPGTVAWTQHLFGGLPFVNKNVKHMLRLPALAALFPQARFLIVERSRPEVALSVLRGRRQHASDPRRTWWSVRPPDVEALLRLPLIEQIAGQLDALSAKLDADLEGLGDKVYRLSYEAFCTDPELLTELVRAAVGGCAGRNPPAGPFDVVRKEPRDDEERALVALVSA